jgi:hypothetical protein
MNGIRPGTIVESKRRSRSMRTAHRGASLVELVVAMGVATVILTTGLATIHLLLSAERESVQSAFRTTTVNRLSRFFRDDVHAATGVTLQQGIPSGGGLTLSMPNGSRIAYAFETQRLNRTVTMADGKLQHEQFRLPIGSTCRFETISDPARVRLVVATPRRSPRSMTSSKTTDTNQTDMNIVTLEAVPSRDHRFEGSP